jgi:hypothetical protein
MAQVPRRSDGPPDEVAPRGPVIRAADRGLVLLQENARATGGSGGRDGGGSWRPPVLLLLIGLAVLALVVMRAPAALRAAPVIAYVITVPGLACVRLAHLSERLAELALGVGLSLALAVVVAQVMIYLKLWSPTLGIAILVAIASIAAGIDLLAVRRPRRAVAPPPPAGRWDG